MRVKHDSLVLFVLACVACSNTDSGELSMPALGGFSGAAGAAGAAGVAPGGMVMPPGQDAGMAGGFGGMGAVGGAAGASGAGWVEPSRDGGDMTDTDAESPDAGARRGALTILNYNVHGLPPLITGDDTPARMSMISPLLNAFDVVGLQEDFEPANHMLLTMDSMHAYLEHYDEPLPNRLYGAGLTILSNPEVVDVHAQHYIACFGELLGPGLTDCVASKGFHVTRLKLAEGVEIDFYNTHMDAGGGPEDIAARESQIDELIDAMGDYSENRAILFVADTNASTSQLERLIDGAGLRDACDDVGCPEPGRIERILVRSGDDVALTVEAWSLEPAFVDAQGWPLSDHPAVSAEIAWAAVP